RDQALRDDPMRMDNINLLPSQYAPRIPCLGQHKSRDEEKFPSASTQIRDDSAIVDQSFHPLCGIAVAHNLDPIRGLTRLCSGGMRTEHDYTETIRQATRQLMHEAWLRISWPARVGGGEYEQCGRRIRRR